MKKKCIGAAIMVLCFFSLPVWAETTETAFTRKRELMVENQLKARGIKDQRVLEAMGKVKRHLFVPFPYRDLAYEDRPLPIGHGQTISQPYIVALMSELLALRGAEKVLEIGTGSGYQAAILGELAKEVYTIELLEPLARSASDLLQKLGYKNVTVKRGDGYLGWPEYAPFDRVIVTAAPEQIPAPLLAQLAEGGILVIPVGGYRQELQLVRKEKGKTTVKTVAPVRFVPLIREDR